MDIVTKDTLFIIKVETNEEFVYYSRVDGIGGGCAEFARIVNLPSGQLPAVGQKIQVIPENLKGQFLKIIY